MIFNYFQFWQGDETKPVYEYGKRKRFTGCEAAAIIMNADSHPRCKKHPVLVRENASFLIDVSLYKDWEDVKNDMNGVFNRVLRCAVWTIKKSADGSRSFEILRKKAVALQSSNEYHLHINSKAHKACPSFVRSIFHLTDSSSNIVLNTVILQYCIIDGKNKAIFNVPPHGNSTGSTPYYPTAKSTLALIKKKALAETPSRAHKAVHSEMGGLANARTPGDLPRSTKQVRDIKGIAKRQSDPVEDLLVYARKKEKGIVLRHEDLPRDLWILGTDVMCNDVSRFSTSEELSYPLSIDPTFNMGQYEVTPIVYKHLFLTSSRTGNNPIFLGPTMIHHRKDYPTFKVFSSACVAACKGLNACKGYITDGEEALDMALKCDLQKATHLRCVRHFESNCKEELLKIGIREKEKQRVLLNEVFGVKGKQPGIIDCEDKSDMKRKLRDVKKVLDEKEADILNKPQGYQPKFSQYILKNQHMIVTNMSLKERRKAGLPDDDNGKPIRPYTNSSEAMNNVMKQAKLQFLSSNGRKHNESLSKLEFTKHVFEEIHESQQEELKLAICGLSKKYTLSDVASHLHVPAETWFSMTDIQRNEYVNKVNELTVKDILEKKSVRVTTSTFELEREYEELPMDVGKILRESLICSKESVEVAINGALRLLNLPAAIQRKATLASENIKVKYEVASKNAKNGMYECAVLKDHVKCCCSSFKFDSVCMHSIAVAKREGMLQEHLKFITKPSNQRPPSKSALAEANVNKVTAGKKGSRNKTKYRPQPDKKSTSKSSNSGAQIYTEIYHNDNPFILRLLPKEAKACKQCHHDFCHRIKVVPYDLVLEHKEKYYFPLNGDWKNKRVAKREASRFYHADLRCIRDRFPYFRSEYIQVPNGTLERLTNSHKEHLKRQFGLQL